MRASKGAPKLEWGTRLVIYALLAMMVPPSAIVAAVVLSNCEAHSTMAKPGGASV